MLANAGASENAASVRSAIQQLDFSANGRDDVGVEVSALKQKGGARSTSQTLATHPAFH